MKRLIFIVSLCLLFSCGNSNSVEISKEEYNELKNIKKSEYPKYFKLYDENLDTFKTGIILGSDGHEYLVTSKNTNSGTVGHYIDCKLCIKRKK